MTADYIFQWICIGIIFFIILIILIKRLIKVIRHGSNKGCGDNDYGCGCSSCNGCPLYHSPDKIQGKNPSHSHGDEDSKSRRGE